MINPKLNLEKITDLLESLGFEAVTKLKFKRGFVDVEIKDGIIPDGCEWPIKPFFQVRVYGPGNEYVGQFDCKIKDFFVFENKA